MTVIEEPAETILALLKDGPMTQTQICNRLWRGYSWSEVLETVSAMSRDGIVVVGEYGQVSLPRTDRSRIRLRKVIDAMASRRATIFMAGIAMSAAVVNGLEMDRAWGFVFMAGTASLLFDLTSNLGGSKPRDTAFVAFTEVDRGKTE